MSINRQLVQNNASIEVWGKETTAVLGDSTINDVGMEYDRTCTIRCLKANAITIIEDRRQYPFHRTWYIVQ